METSIQTFINMCQWDTAKFLIISDNVFAPLIYYSHFFALIPSFLIGLIIILRDRKALINQILFFITTTFALWIFADLVLWANEKPKLIMFFWSLQVIIEPIIYATCVYFVYVFITKKDISLSKKLGIAIFLIPILLFASTKFALLGFNLSNCYRETTEGPLTLYGYGIEIIYLFWILFLAFSKPRSASKEEKQQTFLITTGIILFLLSLTSGNIIGSLTDNWTVAQIGLFGMPLFVAFLAYMIVKFKTFNIKLISAQTLVFALGFFVLAILFIRKIENIRIVVIFTLLFVISLGYALIKSVKKEISQREQIETLAFDLHNTNNGLKDANIRLREIDKQKTEFVSFATHQLRSPLTAMKGYTSLILEGDYGDINFDLRIAIERISESSNTLTAVVNDYLNISRIELGAMKYDLQPTDLKDLVKDVIGELQPSIDKSGLKFKFEVNARSKYFAKIDTDKFKQVIGNIIDNSMKYTPTGSIVVSVTKDVAKNTVLFAVKDTGIGMKAGVIPKLFAKFSRAENANKVNMRGTGLGLYVAKEIVKAHKGRIWAESEGEGNGSQFYVELPGER